MQTGVVQDNPKSFSRPFSSAANTKRARRDGLIVAYRRYVQHLVGSLIKAMNLPQDCYEEFVSAGYLGLVEAAERFDSSSKAEFKTFAYLRIRGAVIDCIRASSQLSGTAYKYARALQASHQIREQYFESQKNVDKGGIESTLAQMLEYAAKSTMTFRLSYQDAEEEVVSIVDQAGTPELAIEQMQNQKQLRSILKKLPANERLVLECYYFRDMTFEEIARDQMKASKSWASRLHERAITRLKELYAKECAD